MDNAYIITREKDGRNWYQILKAPNGSIVKHFGDSQMSEAEALRDLLNAAYEAGWKARNAAYRDLREENDNLSSKIIGLQFELGKAEAKAKANHPYTGVKLS